MDKRNKRPVNLDLTTVEFPLAALVSFTHRVTGIAIVPGIAILMYLFSLSLSSEDGFNTAKHYLDNFSLKILVWLVLCVITYHTVAGVKHLIMDLGIGESLEGGRFAAKITVVVSIVLCVAAGIWLF